MKKRKLIFIVLDGLNAEIAYSNMGFMYHLVEEKLATYYTAKTQLPALSRPLYEVLLTGVSPAKSGIVSNKCTKLSVNENLFSIVKKAGYKTGASAYYWLSELYNNTPFDKTTDFISLDKKEKAIENGIFYYEDYYPDTHVFSGADFLLKEKNTDFTFVHSMNIDFFGHEKGLEAYEYVRAAINVDTCLSQRILKWIKEDIDIIITADHGMTKYGLHNGISKEEREIPLYIISKKVKTGDFKDTVVNQNELAPLALKLMGLEKTKKMVDAKSVKFN